MSVQENVDVTLTLMMSFPVSCFSKMASCPEKTADIVRLCYSCKSPTRAVKHDQYAPPGHD